MSRSCRPLLLAVMLNVTAGAGAAWAQTVFLKSAPAGATVDVLVNGTPAGTGTVGTDGQAQVPFDLHKAAGKDELDANVYVDVCGQKYRVSIVERTKQPPIPDSACDRRDIPGIFWVRTVNTLVIDVADSTASMLLIRGPYNPPKPETPEGGPSKPKFLAPTGLVMFGGGGWSNFRDLPAVVCGNVPQCTAKNSRPDYTFGAEYWFTRYTAAEVSYVKPTVAKATGDAGTYRFDSALDAHVFTIEGKGGAAIGRVRIYGHGGLDYHQATLTTNETVDPVTLTLDDGSTITIPGGTQTFTMKTQGWSWVYGGGTEVWITRKVATYGEFGFARLKGKTTDGSQGAMDDHFFYAVIGARVRLQK